MPELPEVETVCRELQKILTVNPSCIREIQVLRRDLRVLIPKKLSQDLIGQKILNVRRRAKYLIFDTEKFTILSHLGMSGSWRIESDLQKSKKHDHCYIIFDNCRQLIYNDPRRFGLIELYSTKSEAQSRWLKHLGLEPFDQRLTGDYLRSKAKGKLTIIKNFIMNQKNLVGVGNIYAAEALFKAHVRPTRRIDRINRVEWHSIVEAIRSVLDSAIKNGGTTLRDYRQASGAAGNNQQSLNVYGRLGEKCKQCHSKINLRQINGRSTYWCPSCQK